MSVEETGGVVIYCPSAHDLWLDHERVAVSETSKIEVRDAAQDAKLYRWLRDRLEVRQIPNSLGELKLGLRIRPGCTFLDSKLVRYESNPGETAAKLDAAIDSVIASASKENKLPPAPSEIGEIDNDAALRLAVEQGMQLCFDPISGLMDATTENATYSECDKSDPLAAARRAIVRAAAEDARAESPPVPAPAPAPAPAVRMLIAKLDAVLMLYPHPENDFEKGWNALGDVLCKVLDDHDARADRASVTADVQDAKRYRNLAALVAVGEWSVGIHETIDTFGRTKDTFMDDKADMDAHLDQPAVVADAESCARVMGRAAAPQEPYE